MRTLWIRLRMAVLAMLCAQTMFTVGLAGAQAPNYQGLWWNAPAGSESGWGINLAHQGDTIFATWFTYDHVGEGWWLSMTAHKIADRAYAGMLIETVGPAFNAVPFDPAKVVRMQVGTGTLTFSDANNGSFTYNVKGVQQTKTITRQVFGRVPTCTYGVSPNFAATTNYQDLWWAPYGAESGWGINLTHQSDYIFATWFTYDAGGAPMWLSETASKTGPLEYSGILYRTEGPSFNALPFRPELVKRTPVGIGVFTFSDGNAAAFAYTLDGIETTKYITRQLFAPPAGTVCGPSRTVTNSFTVDTEGWTAIGVDGFNWKSASSEYSDPDYGAHLEAIDGAMSPWYFWASSAFYGGDISSFYGGKLTYRLRWKADEVSACRLRGKHDYYYQDWWKPDVQIIGRNNVQLGYFSPYPPDLYVDGLVYYNQWAKYSVPMERHFGMQNTYTYGWVKYCEGRPDCYTAATNDEILSVLKDVGSLWIRGEYCLGSHDRGMLDEVILEAPD